METLILIFFKLCTTKLYHFSCSEKHGKPQGSTDRFALLSLNTWQKINAHYA
jgi:hypothetical protein